MFRKLLFLSMIVLIMTSSLYPQNIPLLDTSRVWSSWYNYAIGGGGMCGFRIKAGEKDTIGNQIYYNLMYSSNEHPEEWYRTKTYLREDSTGKVWMYGLASGQDYMLYDFSMMPGDTLDYMICDAVDSIYIGDHYRRRLSLHCTQKSSATLGDDIWIEGLGSMHTFLLAPMYECVLAGIRKNVCITEHSILVYQNSQFSDCLPYNSLYSTENWIADNSAVWCYDYLEENPFSSTPNEGFVNISVIKDTLIQGHNCKKLLCQQYDHLGQGVRNTAFYTYYSDRKVYYSLNTSFSILYDFGAQPGDSWTLRNPFEIYGLTPTSDSLTTIFVDSIDIKLDHFPVYYKRLFTHSNSSWFYNKPLQVRSGGDGFMFPGRWADWSYPYPGGLRYYTDNIMWGLSGQNQLCEDLITGISYSEKPSNRYRLVNPITGDFQVFINDNTPESGFIMIYDEYGKVLSTATFNNQTEIKIPGAYLSPGIYFVRICSEQKNSLCLKAIKY
ncbi:MAG: T9SS type A sorting domain-containing protein [Bacteroidales bacterium]